jgi:opacity protein-like surface antigen
MNYPNRKWTPHDGITAAGIAAATVFVAFLLLGLFTFGARAQELKPACYVEALAGTNISAAKTDVGITTSTKGLSGALGAGCDIKINSAIVGALARYEITSSDGSLMGLKVEAKPSWTLAARAGMYVNPHVLAYGLLGYSGTNFEIDTVAKVGHRGITYGLGTEIAASNTPLLLKLEWARTHWGAEDYSGVKVTPATDVIRAGIVYRFGQ